MSSRMLSPDEEERLSTECPNCHAKRHQWCNIIDVHGIEARPTGQLCRERLAPAPADCKDDLRPEREILLDIERKVDDVIERLESIACKQGDAPWVP